MGLLIATMVAFIVGSRPDADMAAVVVAVELLLFATYSFMWVFITIGLISANAHPAQGTATLLIVPLAFVSAAYVPADTLPGWMQPVANNQPLTIAVNAVRSLLLGGAENIGLGHSTGYWVALNLIWFAAIPVVFASIAVARFARRASTGAHHDHQLRARHDNDVRRPRCVPA